MECHHMTSCRFKVIIHLKKKTKTKNFHSSLTKIILLHHYTANGFNCDFDKMYKACHCINTYKILYVSKRPISRRYIQSDMYIYTWHDYCYNQISLIS